MPTEYIRRIVNLEPRDYDAIKQHAEDQGLGKKGFSVALRLIIREWQEFKTVLNCLER
jgi:hypothetical protein